MQYNYSPEMIQQLTENLETAIKHKELELEYEPIIELKNSRVIGISTLVRWRHPKYGKIMPKDFIQLAETNDNINILGEWVLKHACRQFSQWQRQKIIDDSLKLAINISLKQLEQENFLEKTETIFHQTRIKHDQIEFQLTESQILDKRFIPILKTIHKKGIKLTLDNFGMPFSSLAYLSLLDVETIEIDRSFISQIGDPEGNKLVSIYFTVLKQQYGIKVLAEGVETQAQLDFLQKYDCDFATGFYFTKPLDANGFERFLQKNYNMRKKIIDFDFLEQSFGKKIKATVIASLKDWRPNLLEQMTTIENAYQKQDWQLMEDFIHKLKGGCACIGALKARNVAESLEIYLSKHDKPDMALYQRLKEEVKILVDYLEAGSYLK